MIRIEEWTVPSPEQMMLTIQGMRNPMDSWNKSDSYIIYDCPGDCESCDYDACKNDLNNVDGFVLGVNDHNLMKSLAKAGSDHRKFMRMMPVHIRITAPLYWWKEFDTYRTGVAPNPTDIEMNSCSTMHKIHKKELTLDDFSHEHLTTRSLDILLRTIKYLNECRDLYINYDNHDNSGYTKPTKKEVWWQMIQLLPSSYNQTRNIALNYEALMHMYYGRKNHKQDEWRDFCEFVKDCLPYSDLITGEDDESDYKVISIDINKDRDK